jgi:hypothetical protein
MPVKDESQSFLRSAENEIERAIELGTIKVFKEAGRLIRQHSSLKTGRRSVKGQPPFKEWGVLAQKLDSETFEHRRGKSREFLGRVGYVNYKVAFWLELGTSRMGKRPFLRPALDSQRRAILAEIKKAGGRFRSKRSG